VAGQVQVRITSEVALSATFSKEESMLFHVSWAFVDTSEEGQRRSLAVFAKWQPPAGAATPIVPIEESSAIALEAVAFRDSVS
jgi:hypothetical protein